jgi:vacuolar-type H+-ATPase subunit H
VTSKVGDPEGRPYGDRNAQGGRPRRSLLRPRPHRVVAIEGRFQSKFAAARRTPWIASRLPWRREGLCDRDEQGGRPRGSPLRRTVLGRPYDPRVDAPPLGPVTPGRPALAAFGPVEAWIRDRLAEARAEGERRVAEARVEAERIRREGEARLRDLVREGQDAALREAEDRARDRVSRARVEVNRWIERVEATFPASVETALDRIAGFDGTSYSVIEPREAGTRADGARDGE